MSELPARIEILEEGPREGFQGEPPGIPTAAKVELIEALADTGLSEINCASFVSPKVMPQMADAEEIASSISRKPGIAYRGMWLSKNGFIRAAESGLDLRGTTSASASDSFLAKNNNRTPEAYLADQAQMLDLFDEYGIAPGPLYVFTAFGCNYEGDVPAGRVMERIDPLMQLFAERGEAPSHIMLCDTIGAANPAKVRRLIEAVRTRWPEQMIALHLHDTRGLGMACAMAGLELGAVRFDASVGGMGGCPFAGNKAASGNIATEELVLLCDGLGIETGVDLPRLIDAATMAERIVGHPLPSRLAQAGVFRASGAQ